MPCPHEETMVEYCFNPQLERDDYTLVCQTCGETLPDPGPLEIDED